MKGKEWLVAFMLGIVVPGLIITGAEKLLPLVEKPTNPTEPIVSDTIPVLIAESTIVTMDLNQYLVGVLLGEVPADFELQALMAQAVVARTYACKRNMQADKHPDGAICTSASCCQAYRPVEQYLSEGGKSSAVDRVRQAVERTSGQVLVYDGKLIDATYFSCSGGSTEDAAAVWGTDFPYLRAVDSPGEEYALHHTDRVYFTKGDFTAALALKLTGNPTGWIGSATYTAGGGVDTIEIGGKTFTGKELRSLLGLRSTAFSMAPDEWGVAITTKGFGHRVGMSQYGAQAMAQEGSSFSEILAHYYTGTELGP